jgi:ligand-binding sensor domain-containing protein
MSALAAVLFAVAAQVHVSPREVKTCLVLPGGAVAAGTDAGVVVVEAGAPGASGPLHALPGARVEALAPALDRPGEPVFWAGTDAGLARVRWSPGRIEVERVFPGPPVRAVASLGSTVYAGTWESGLWALPAGAKALAVMDPAIAHISALAVRKDSLYVGSAGEGLYRLEGDRLAAVPAALPSPIVWAVAAQGERVFVGTLEGLAVLGEDQPPSRRLAADVRALGSSAAGLLVGTYGAGVFLVSADGSRRDEPVSPFIGSVMERDGSGCAAGPEGLWIRPRGLAAWRRTEWDGPPSNDLSALVRQGRRLVAGTFDQGIGVLEDGRWHPLGDPGIDARINALVADGERLWIATARGLCRLEGGEVRRWTEGEGLPSEDVHALAVLRDGRVVVGTARGAAVIRNGRVERLASAALGPVAIWAVAEQDDGTLWLGTSQGLITRSSAGRWRRLSVASGELQDDWVTALATSGPVVWAGTYGGGVTRLHYAPGRRLRARSLGGGSVNPGGLRVVGDTLYAATTDGLRARPLQGGGWTSVGDESLPPNITAVTPGQDGEEGLWVASRSGLVLYRSSRAGSPSN